MKTVLFVPGSGEDMHSRDYTAVLRAIEAKGYKTRFIPVEWRRTTIDDWVKQLMEAYATYDSAEIVLAGFSWGAMTAFVAAAERQPAELWLCSLSPYFSDDKAIHDALHGKPPRFLGKHRTEAFAKLDFVGLAHKIDCKTLVFIGDKEAVQFPDLKRRCEIASIKISHSRLTYVPDAGHEVDHPKYIASIEGQI